MRDRFLEVVLPAGALILALAGWEFIVRYEAIPPYLLPAPSLIISTLFGADNRDVLFGSLAITLRITFEALTVAVLGGVAMALLFAQSRLVERTFFPFAVILQVTPIIAVAPLLLVYLGQAKTVLFTGFLVAFFPILSNTTLGLASADHNLIDLFDLYGASRLQQLFWLRLPSALPFFLGGLRIGGGLALIGAIVAELVAGSAGANSGLAFRISESAFRLNMPRLFAALLLISVAGICIFLFFTALSYFLLHRWHDSARGREA
jgi:NitT/TauT family transport system permease protein